MSHENDPPKSDQQHEPPADLASEDQPGKIEEEDAHDDDPRHGTPQKTRHSQLRSDPRVQRLSTRSHAPNSTRQSSGGIQTPRAAGVSMAFPSWRTTARSRPSLFNAQECAVPLGRPAMLLGAPDAD